MESMWQTHYKQIIIITWRLFWTWLGILLQYNIPDFCLAFAFFLAYLHIFGKEMKNYTGDQKSKIIFFDHL